MANVEANVLYGMYSGLALLMDVHHPPRANGYAIVHIPGSGWSAPMGYDAAPLKEPDRGPVAGRPQSRYIAALAGAGYTVFTINHRAAPRFHYPAAIEDAQRAVRYIRFHAARYGVNQRRIGALGGSSGAHLVSLLGVLDGAGDADDADPVNRESARVQCVVARGGLFDFIGAERTAAIVALGGQFLGMGLAGSSSPPSLEHRTYRAASPIAHVTSAAAPHLLLHGDADTTLPIDQAERMDLALRQAGVPVRLVRISGGGHGPDFPGASDPPDYLLDAVHWFDLHLPEASVQDAPG